MKITAQIVFIFAVFWIIDMFRRNALIGDVSAVVVLVGVIPAVISGAYLFWNWRFSSKL